MAARPNLRISGFRFGGVHSKKKIEEFDPGSDSTLAAWLKHASRTRKYLRVRVEWRKGEEYVPTYPKAGDSSGKPGVIPDTVLRHQRLATLGAGNVLSGSW